MSVDVAPRESAAPRTVRPDEEFDLQTDVVVVGGGASGLPAALFSRWLGNHVLLLEKAPQLGGTANKAAFWYWVPNNERMHELGLRDDERAFLRYCARLAVPHAYEDEAPTGRVFVPRDARESMSDGGLNAIRTMSAAAHRDGVDVRLGHRVQRLLRDGASGPAGEGRRPSRGHGRDVLGRR